jgi:predicted aspartyl protease
MRQSVLWICLGLLAACGGARAAGDPSELAPVLEGSGYVSVEVTKLASGHDVVMAQINGVEGAFIVDTGAGYTVLSTESKGKFELYETVLSTERSGGAGGVINLSLHPVDRVAVAGVETSLEAVYVTDLGNVMTALSRLYGAPLSGIVGQDALRALGAVLDVRRDALFLQSDHMAPCLRTAPGCSDRIDAQLVEDGFAPIEFAFLTTGHIVVAAEINGGIGTFLIDSGARESFLDLGSVDAFRANGVRKLEPGRQINGAGGDARSFRLPVAAMAIEGIAVRKEVIGVADLSAVKAAILDRGGGEVHGVIGQDILQAHDAVIDLMGARLFLRSSGEAR